MGEFKPKKIARPQEEIEEPEEVEEEYEEEEEIEEPPQQKAKPKAKPQEGTKITVNDVLVNHESRLKELEASVFRLRSI